MHAQISIDEMEQKIRTVFTPAMPIKTIELFAGRKKQIEALRESVREPGMHAIIYGERGVGKTSLANITPAVAPDAIAKRIAINTHSNFTNVWDSFFKMFVIEHDQPSLGFIRRTDKTPFRFGDVWRADSIEDVVSGLKFLVSYFDKELVFVLDEFDRLQDGEAKRLLADTIKSISDEGMPVTLVIVGVGQTVTELLGEHLSVVRNLRQIELPRMTREELTEVIERGLRVIGMNMAETVKHKIVALSQGFPHYTHLLSRSSSIFALRADRLDIREEDLDQAIQKSIEDVSHSIKDAYRRAVLVTKKRSLFPDVLLAAAIVPTDEFGAFRAIDLVEPLRKITGNSKVSVSHYTYHLGKLVSPERGSILERMGTKKRYKYRFTNPLMRPYLLMRGYAEGKIRLDGDSTA